MNLFYLKRGKEELNMALQLFSNLNDSTIVKLVEHLVKGMDFMIDYLNDKHTELISDIVPARIIIENVLDKDFLETYFYLNSLKNKSLKVLKPSSILVDGKKIEHYSTDEFKMLMDKVVSYFNTVYEKTENGSVWV